MHKKLPDQDYLESLFLYNPRTGSLVWRINKSSRARIGVEADCINAYGYYSVSIDYKRYLVHRVIWKMVNGEDPIEVDHVNGIRSDNRIKNLRSVTSQVNSKNSGIRSDNTTGVVGVYWNKATESWRSIIRNNGKNVHLGLFKNKKDAIEARKNAEIKYEYHKNHGRV